MIRIERFAHHLVANVARGPRSSRVFDGHRFAIGAELGQLLARRVHVGTLALQEVGHGAAQRRIDDEVHGVGLGRQVAARQLVLALRARLDPRNLCAMA